MTDSALYDLLTDTSLSSTAFASYQADSLLDWSQVPKTIPDFGLDVDLMDLGFNPSLANDPTALHLDLFSTTELSPFPPQQQVLFPDTLAPRTMNITSSPSPGASLSSIQDPAGISTIACIPSAAAASPNLLPSAHVTVIATVNDPIDELAQFVRQAAGVTLAVPVPGQAEQSTFSSMYILVFAFPLLSNRDLLDSPKLLIPRLQPPPMTSAGSKRKSPLAESTPSLDPALGGTVAAIGRRKTSHTTIERRYRTNLNTRTQSLKDAVPALRVLESKERAKKGQHSPEGPEPDEKLERSAWDDIIDGRGFVDGVKVARKISKGIVLGKAAEYIQ